MYSVCVDRDQSRLEQLYILQFLTVFVNLQRVSVLWSHDIQYQISCNLQSITRHAPELKILNISAVPRAQITQKALRFCDK